MTQALLEANDLTAYDRIRPDDVGPAMQALIADAEAALARATSDSVPATYEALSASLEVATERLERAWGAVNHLNAVLNTPELRAAVNESLPAITAFYTALGADTALYAYLNCVF